MNLYGIWIDHAHALIVKAHESGDMTVSTVTSGVEPHHHSGDTGGEHLTITNQHHDNNARANEIHAFTKMIIGHMHDADEIIIFGPGTAKHDLKHAVEKENALAHKFKRLETTDKMTENQLMAYVRELYDLPQK